MIIATIYQVREAIIKLAGFFQAQGISPELSVTASLAYAVFAAQQAGVKRVALVDAIEHLWAPVRSMRGGTVAPEDDEDKGEVPS